MKNVIFLLLTAVMLFGCKKNDDFYGESPNFVFDSVNSVLEPVPGEYLYVRGTVTSEAPLKSIRIIIESWELDKTINIKDQNVLTYNLDYKFIAPDAAGADKNAEIKILITDAAGQQTLYIVYVSATGDSSSPKIYADKNLRLELKSEYSLEEEFPNRVFPLKFDVVDDKSLAYVNVTCNELNYSKSVSLGTMEYHFHENFHMIEDNVYNFVITAGDIKGNEVKKDIAVLGVKDYPIIYLADVKTDVDLQSDLFGVPMETVKDKRYCFHAIYFSRNENTEVRFLNNEVTFLGSTFGYDDSDNLLTAVDSDAVNPIVLPKKNQYYKISMDIKERNISVEEIQPNADPNKNTKVGLLKGASGWMDNPGWNPEHAIELTKCTENTFLMWADIEVNAEHQRLDYTFTGVGKGVWNPQFRFRSVAEPDIVVPGNSGSFSQFPYTISENTVYRFYLDTYANRSWAVPTSQLE